MLVIGAAQVAQRLKHPPAMQETCIWSLGQEDPLEKEMATHSSLLAWRIPWTEEPGGLQSTGFQRVGHHWATNTLSIMCRNFISIWCIINKIFKRIWTLSLATIIIRTPKRKLEELRAKAIKFVFLQQGARGKPISWREYNSEAWERTSFTEGPALR